MEKKLSIHIPIPFAPQKCLCDPDTCIIDAPAEIRRKYLDAVCREMMLFAPECQDYVVSSILLDGGPVQSFPPPDLTVFVRRILKNFRCVEQPTVILTVDPFGIDHVRAANYAACGATLMDVRLFSSVRSECEAIGRPFPHHSFQYAADKFRSFHMENVGAQVFCGLPGQTAESMYETMEECAREDAKHVTLRCFAENDLHLLAADRLKEKGYVEYTPGRFGKEGFCFDCFVGETDVLGLGLHAVTVMDGVRSVTTGDLETYLAYSGDVSKTAVEVSLI